MELEATTLVAKMSVLNYFMHLCNFKTEKKRKKRRWWMIKIHRRRTRASMEEQFSDLMAENALEFYNFVRMSASDFEIVLKMVEPLISKRDTKFRMAIPAKVRLALTLRYLATGDSYRILHFLFKISHQVISKIIREVCLALVTKLDNMIKELLLHYLEFGPIQTRKWIVRVEKSHLKLWKIPANEREWLQKEAQFREIFPHCVGSIDGKHVVLVAPIHSGSDYFNYKHSFSIVMMAAVDRNFCFMFCDIGTRGRISDGGVFRDTMLYEKLCTNTLNLPQSAPLPGSNVQLPYVFVADNAFPLSENLMKPYPGEHAEGSIKRKFNRKLSSARIVVENAFGVMSARFRVLRRPIPLQPILASKVVMSCALLHNFLMKSKASSNIYTPPGYLDSIENEGDMTVPGGWRSEIDLNTSALRPLSVAPRRSSMSAMEIRNRFADFFILR